jgi:hypothetical protein
MGRKLCLLPSLPPGAFSCGASLSHALCAKIISSSIDKVVIGTGLKKNYGLPTQGMLHPYRLSFR